MKKKIFEITFLVLLFSILSLSNLNAFCKVYPILGADNGALLLWKYAAETGMFPYRDIFYPYGLLSYYQGQNIFLAIFYFLFTPILLTGLFLCLKKLFKDKLFTITAFIFFYLFIITITGFETFNRYGLLTTAAMFFAYIFYHDKNKEKKILFISGVLVGLLFAFINDFGFYASVLFTAIAFINTWIKSQFKMRVTNLVQFFSEIARFFLGCFIGLLPFVIYLILTGSFSGFIFYLQNLSDIGLFAKTPYFHAIVSIDNIFTLGILLVTICFLSLKFFLGTTKTTFNNYLQMGLVIVLILFEQKSIIRMIDTQISFVGLLLFFCLFYEILQYSKTYKIKKQIIYFYFVNISIAIVFLIGLHSATQTNPFIMINDTVTAVTTVNNKSCVDYQMEYVVSNNPQIMQVKEQVEKIEGFNGKVFTFPGEPIFYILFGQKPPYYPTIYEATPKYSQEMLIDYLEKENIEIVLYNIKIKSVHDEVPDVVRGKYLYHYIQTHFSVYKKVNDYIILRRITQS